MQTQQKERLKLFHCGGSFVRSVAKWQSDQQRTCSHAGNVFSGTQIHISLLITQLKCKLWFFCVFHGEPLRWVLFPFVFEMSDWMYVHSLNQDNRHLWTLWRLSEREIIEMDDVVFTSCEQHIRADYRFIINLDRTSAENAIQLFNFIWDKIAIFGN